MNLSQATFSVDNDGDISLVSDVFDHSAVKRHRLANEGKVSIQGQANRFIGNGDQKIESYITGSSALDNRERCVLKY